MTLIRRGQPTALALLLAAAACTTSEHVVGNAPETEPQELGRRPDPSAADRAERIRRHEEAAANAEPQEVTPPVDQPRVGVAATRVFHRPDCKLLAGVATVEQVRFPSPWEAVDARYAPCPECHPFQ